MELTEKDVISMIGLIKANYPYAYKDVSKSDMEMLTATWFRSFLKYPKEVVGIAFQKAIETCKMPPTIADVIMHINSLQEAIEPNDNELWCEFEDALYKGRRELYYMKYPCWENGKPVNHQERFNIIYSCLNELIKSYCGDVNGFRNITNLNDEQLLFEKGRFIKILPVLKNRLRIKNEVNPNILAMVSGINLIGNNDKLKIENK